MTPRVRRAGDRALLVECASTVEAIALHAGLVAVPLEAQLDVLPGARTVFVRFGPGADLRAAARALAGRQTAAPASTPSRRIRIDVVYDGDDLDDVAGVLGVARDAVIAAHTASEWTVAFCGFAPGFAYLDRPGAPMPVPRRREPRIAVPAGAVALAGEYSAVYPSESPGGWQLIGRAGTAMWDAARAAPSLLGPGDTVEFRAVREVVRASAAAPAPPPEPDRGIVVESPGFFALVEDLGRPGHASAGVSASGALDRRALRQANRLVGNPSDAAALELLPAGVVLRARGDQVLALTGADPGAGVVDADGARRAVPVGTAFALADGDRVELGVPAAGFRSYLAVRGGIAAPATLGSRSRDGLGRLGLAPLAPGDVIAVGDAAVAEPGTAWPEPAARTGPVRLVRGPRDDRFAPGALDAVAAQPWTVTPASNRIGLRLAGPTPLVWAEPDELPSEGVAVGSVQVPPSGQPIVFLADHPVTGGYPVIGVVADADLDRLAQCAPGDELRFAWVDEEPVP